MDVIGMMMIKKKFKKKFKKTDFYNKTEPCFCSFSSGALGGDPNRGVAGARGSSVGGGPLR